MKALSGRGGAASEKTAHGSMSFSSFLCSHTKAIFKSFWGLKVSVRGTAHFQCQTAACSGNASCFLFRQIHKSHWRFGASSLRYREGFTARATFAENTGVLTIQYNAIGISETQASMYSGGIWQMVIGPLPDFNASQLLMLKYVTRSPSSISDSGIFRVNVAAGERKRGGSCWYSARTRRHLTPVQTQSSQCPVSV